MNILFIFSNNYLISDFFVLLFFISNYYLLKQKMHNFRRANYFATLIFASLFLKQKMHKIGRANYFATVFFASLLLK